MIGWGLAIAAAASAYRAAQEQQRMEYEKAIADKAAMCRGMMLCGFYANGDPLPKPTRLIYTQSKCPSCGSREWVAHAGKEVCAYCRSDRA